MLNLTQDEIYEMLSRVDSTLKANKIKKMDFYKFVGITSGAFSQWKSGATSPKPENIKRIADYLGVTESYLVDGVDAEKAVTPEGDGLDEQKKELIRLWDLVSDDVKMRELDYLRVQAAAKRSSADEQDK